MIPPSLHTPTFFCRSFKVGDLLIGKNAYEELSEYLGQYKFSIGPYRMYSLENYITNDVKAIRGYILSPSSTFSFLLLTRPQRTYVVQTTEKGVSIV